MKLVVCYGHGSEGSGFWHENLCIESESKEQFLLAFIEAFDVWVNRIKEQRKLWKKMADARASGDKNSLDSATEEYLQHIQEKMTTSQ